MNEAPKNANLICFARLLAHSAVTTEGKMSSNRKFKEAFKL
jgi:hypothetical protein